MLRKGQLNRHTRYRPMLRKGQLNRHTRYRPATTARNTATGMYDVHTDPWSYLAPPDRRSNCEWYQPPKIKWPTWCGNVAADSESDRLGLRFAHEQASKQQVENRKQAHEQSSTDALNTRRRTGTRRRARPSVSRQLCLSRSSGRLWRRFAVHIGDHDGDPTFSSPGAAKDWLAQRLAETCELLPPLGRVRRNS